MIRVGDIARIIERFAPLYLATPDDNSGLQVGDFRQPVRGVMVALDAYPEAVRRAAAVKASLLVTHHPLFFEPCRKIDTASATGAAAAAAVAAGLSIYSAHSNLDSAPRGLAYELAQGLGLSEIEFIAPPASSGRSKLTVFVPEQDVAVVHRAMAEAGAGLIGHYDHCAFMAPGEGVFRPLEGSRPSVGVKGTLQRVREMRLEMLVEDRALAEVVAAMRRAHPYEEAAFDIFPLRPGHTAGLGCIGRLPKVGLAELVRGMGRRFRADVRLTGRAPTRIDTVAVVPGSGGGLVSEVSHRGAQVLVTGEVRYHQMLEAEHLGLGVIELGHDRSEMPAVGLLAGIIRSGLAKEGKPVPVRTYRKPQTGRYLLRHKRGD